jgi:hypothetical protein
VVDVQEQTIMRRFTAAVAFIALVGIPGLNAAQTEPAGQFRSESALQSSLQSANQAQSGASAVPSPVAATVVVPRGTSIELGLTSPLWSKDSGVGSSVYAQTVFPVVVNNRIAVPIGPRVFSPHAQFQIDFTKIIFSTGYTVLLPAQPAGAAAAEDVIAAVATPYVQVSRASGLLLDNGSQVEMVLQLPLALDANSVAAALRRPNVPQLGQAQSTFCRPIPGSPGTSDTVIPGTPGTPGTPPTVIPGAPGQPDIVIPGTPATPGTPDTVIPGSPGTPGIACPAPPVVMPHANTQQYKESFPLNRAAQVGGTPLSAGRYEASWRGLDPSELVQVQIFASGGPTVTAPARVVLLDRKAAADDTRTRAGAVTVGPPLAKICT